jgi:catechol 2,3-dioxygenase-like lactoylglutathione lyase family enzyme
MLQKFTHTIVWCLDQDEAKAFYTEKLGFEVREDMALEGFRWLTVAPQGQPDLELVLMPVRAGQMMTEENATQLRSLVQQGLLGPGVFQTADCRATYRELKSRGVEFLGEPAERPYGIEVMMKDNSGNIYSVVQRPR